MNCPKCGSAVVPGALFCPVCNEPLNTGYNVGYQQPYPYPQQQGYPNPAEGFSVPPGGYTGYPPQGYPTSVPQQQGFPQQPSFPTGYQPAYAYGEQRPPANPLLGAISDLPHVFITSLRSPADAYRELLERRDIFTCPLVAGVMLLVSFLGGMTIMRGFVGVVFALISALTGVSMASDATSMNQGISYVAGRIAPSIGGIAVLCQIFAMLVPVLVLTIYLVAFCKIRFSWPMALGLMTVSTLPTVVVTLLGMLGSLLTPWLAMLLVVCGSAFSYVQLSAMLSFATGRTEAQLFVPKAVCFCLSLAITLLLLALVGGTLMSGVANRMLQLLSNVGSLI